MRSKPARRCGAVALWRGGEVEAGCAGAVEVHDRGADRMGLDPAEEREQVPGGRGSGLRPGRQPQGQVDQVGPAIGPGRRPGQRRERPGQHGEGPVALREQDVLRPARRRDPPDQLRQIREPDVTVLQVEHDVGRARIRDDRQVAAREPLGHGPRGSQRPAARVQGGEAKPLRLGEGGRMVGSVHRQPPPPGSSAARDGFSSVSPALPSRPGLGAPCRRAGPLTARGPTFCAVAGLDDGVPGRAERGPDHLADARGIVDRRDGSHGAVLPLPCRGKGGDEPDDRTML